MEGRRGTPAMHLPPGLGRGGHSSPAGSRRAGMAAVTRAVGPAFSEHLNLEASALAAAVIAVDQLLIHRNALINGSIDIRGERLLQILQTSGLIATGAPPVLAIMAIGLIVMPRLAMVMAPLGLISLAGFGMGLIISALPDPNRRQQRLAIMQMFDSTYAELAAGQLQTWLKNRKGYGSGNSVTISVVSQ